MYNTAEEAGKSYNEKRCLGFDPLVLYKEGGGGEGTQALSEFLLDARSFQQFARGTEDKIHRWPLMKSQGSKRNQKLIVAMTFQVCLLPSRGQTVCSKSFLSLREELQWILPHTPTLCLGRIFKVQESHIVWGSDWKDTFFTQQRPKMRIKWMPSGGM